MADTVCHSDKALKSARPPIIVNIATYLTRREHLNTFKMYLKEEMNETRSEKR